MKIEIIFISSSAPKTIYAKSVYTKGGLLCIHRIDGLLIKYPLCNVFSICSKHKRHMGSGSGRKK